MLAFARRCAGSLGAVLALVACDGPRPPGPRAQLAPPSPGAAAASASPKIAIGASAEDGRAPSAPVDADASTGEPPVAPVLRAAEPFVVLEVEGYAPAVVSLPLGASGRRPVIISGHGNYDRPEWQCEVWRSIVGNAAFVLCPRGVPRPDSPSASDVRFTYGDNRVYERELRAGLDALAARFPEHVDPGAVGLAGFSLGAILGVSVASRDPARFERLALVEGGHDTWTPAVAKAFAAGGGKRVLFACGQPPCVLAAKAAAARLERAGVATRIVHGKGIGHGYHGAVANEVRAALPWLFEEDERFRTLTAPLPP